MQAFGKEFYHFAKCLALIISPADTPPELFPMVRLKALMNEDSKSSPTPVGNVTNLGLRRP
jgi:hypothetical protein